MKAKSKSIVNEKLPDFRSGSFFTYGLDLTILAFTRVADRSFDHGFK